MQAYLHTKTCAQVFAADLFVTAPKLKQPNVYQGVNKHIVGYPYMELLLSNKKE